MPLNISYAIHRYSEFMMLMLGETVLQAIISPQPDHRRDFIVVQIAGFVLTLCMLYSYNITEPHEAKDHASKRDSMAGVVYNTLFDFKAFSVLLVGIAVKIVLGDPEGLTSLTGQAQCRSDRAHDCASPLYQWRVLLAVSHLACHALQLAMHPLHKV